MFLKCCLSTVKRRVKDLTNSLKSSIGGRDLSITAPNVPKLKAPLVAETNISVIKLQLLKLFFHSYTSRVWQDKMSEISTILGTPSPTNFFGWCILAPSGVALIYTTKEREEDPNDKFFLLRIRQE